MTTSNEKFIGESSVRVFVPSRRKDGALVDRDLRSEWTGRSYNALSDAFGGASPQEVIGSFVHDDGRVTREEITILTSNCAAEALGDTGVQRKVFDFAGELCAALGQESIFVGWGDESYLVTRRFLLDQIAVISFKSLDRDARAQHVTMGWGGIDNPSKILQVLSLDMWALPKAVDTPEPRLALRAEHPEGRRAWSWTGTFEELGGAWLTWQGDAPSSGDLVFLSGPNVDLIDVVLVSGRQLHGPRGLRRSAGSMNPVTRQLLYRILDRDWAGLERDLTQKNLDKRFFQQLKRLQSEIQQHATAAVGAKRAFEISVVFVGRMMFLRFLAQKGWLPGRVEGMLEQWNILNARFYLEYIRPLWFDVLNTPVDARSAAIRQRFPDFPYLNGGLFQEIEGEEKLDLPSTLFDPQDRGSFLSLFQEFEFSLNEHGGSDETLRVDPSLFGRVLESFNSDVEKKKDGIHYTPKKIALALAQEGILARLAVLTKVDRLALDQLADARYDAVSPEQAERIRGAVEKLRIVDPAVGSGVLLWAALDVLLNIHSVCDGIAGGRSGYEPGSRTWGRWSRHFVTHCLFGVDISSEGVALTRLRLWLAVALTEDAARALPDLQLNIVVGDSLGAPREWVAKRGAGESAAVPGRDMPAVKSARARVKPVQAIGKAKTGKRPGTDRQFHLGLESIDQMQNNLVALLRDYEQVEDVDVLRQRELRAMVERARQDLAGDDGRPADFSWDLFFPQVFDAQKKGGFDVVIANPPYIRVQNIAEETKARWLSISNRNADLSFAFIELALRRLAAPDRGQVAYIQPNFRHHDAGATIRQMLMGQHPDVAARLRLWVDFDDQQVFDTATNYVAMLFAERLPSKQVEDSFVYSTPTFASNDDARDIAWLRPNEATHRHPAMDEWLTVGESRRDAVLSNRQTLKRCLGDIAAVEVGIQTSCDDVFLFDDCQPGPDGTVLVRAKGSESAMRIESGIVRECKKGSSTRKRWVLLPYSRDGQLLPVAELKKNYSLAWKYLCKKRETLEGREKGAFRDDRWYRLGRSQGVAACFQPKLLVPSLLKEPVALLDTDGSLAFTASGKGGGGAWCVRPHDSSASLDELRAILLSPEAWEHIRAFGSPQQGGWRGVDQRVLEAIPCK